MELASILTRDCVVVCAKVNSKRQVLQLAADRAAAKTGLKAHEIFETLLEREHCGSTGLGGGIAIPHGKLDNLDGVMGIFLLLEQPVDFDAVDDGPVDIVFVLLAPKGAGANHLKALSRVTRGLREESTVAQLRATRDADRLYELLTRPATAHNAA
ncbi:MAG: PTS transporter subunit EIIA [Alphaproteobacteria bacterium]|nr:PTS transporter subunit EIIA [Alphaproteobacteria bacterium]